MRELLDHLIHLDRAVIADVAALHWTPATIVLTLVSAWWVKGPLFVAAAVLHDVRRRLVPLTALALGAAVLLADQLSGEVKQLVGRPRPPVDTAGAVDALVHLPGSYSFPSGHASTTFAAAAAIALLMPRLRWPALGVAALVGFSRVYLGVHYTFDVLAGATLGAALGIAVALAVRPLLRRTGHAAPAPAAA